MNNTNNNTYTGNNSLLLTAGEPALISYHMGNHVYGSYDNIRLVANPYDGWRKQPANVPLKNPPMVVYQGTPLPLANEVIYSYPPKDSMFVFNYNNVSPECCPSTYSTDRGCVCTTNQQRTCLSTMRAGNKTWPSGPY